MSDSAKSAEVVSLNVLRIEGFLEELTRLTEKYKIKITACGCCDNMQLYELGWPGKYECDIGEDYGEYEESKLAGDLIFCERDPDK